MKQTVEIHDLKCGGCEATIKNKLKSLKGGDEVSVNLEKSTVSFATEAGEAFTAAEKMLSKFGYPLVTDKNSLGKIAKSYISFTLGRMEN